MDPSSSSGGVSGSGRTNLSPQTTGNSANKSSSVSSNEFNNHLGGRSKSLASASSIAAANESLSRSSITKPTSRSGLVLRASNMNDPKELHNSIVRSIQQHSIQSNNNNKRTIALPGTSVGMRIFDTTVGNQRKTEVVRRLQQHCSTNMAEINSPTKGAKVAPVKQQPTINIISNPNFEQMPKQPSNLIEVSQTISECEAIDSSTPITEGSLKPTKLKRNATSLSSSLRRLITITFSRNTASSSSKKNANNSNNDPDIITSNSSSSNSNTAKVKRTKQQRDKTSLYKNVADNKRRQQSAAVSKRSNFSAQASPQQANFNNPSNNIDISKRYSQVGTALGAGAGTATTTTTTTTTTTNTITSTAGGDKSSTSTGVRRQTASDTDGNSKESVFNQPPPPYGANASDIDGNIECPLCVLLVSEASTPYLAGCRHRVCLECMQRYITTEINHSRLNITCPICSEPIHPNTIKDILQNEKYYLKYESFMLRRVLAAEPDARWCPAPDCGYVVLANGCASCPRLVCGRDGCDTSFCYHCKQEWHPNQTCSAASIQRNKTIINAYNINDLIEESAQSTSNRKSSKSSQATSIRADNIKECPVCTSRIIKMNDGSCNHMTCSICETEFCWLCMKEISDLHYFSPSGCTFWGKKPWSLKKKLLWQLGMLVGAPICIILIAGIAVPAIVIGIPVWAARKLHTRLERKPFSRYSKNAIITGGVLLSFVVSPIISAVALAIGIPILLGYVYGVVPLSLCRSSGLCLSTAPSLENLQHEFQVARNVSIQARDGISIDTAMSHKIGDPSIGETSLYMSNISLETNSIGHVTNVEREDRESASNAALAGSIISNTADDGNSTRALAGSIISKESGYTLIPAEVHSSLNQAGNHQMTVESVNLAKSPYRKSIVRVSATSS